MHNVLNDHDVLDAVNAMARSFVNSSLQPGEPRLPDNYRCDMSRVGSIRRCWEKAVEEYKREHGVDPVESLARIEAELRRNAAVLHVERLDA